MTSRKLRRRLPKSATAIPRPRKRLGARRRKPARISPPPAPATPPAAKGDGDGDGRDADRIAASPLARRMAKQAGIDLSATARLGSGRPDRQGRHRGGVAAEVRRPKQPAPAPAPPASPQPQPLAKAAPAIAGAHSLVPNSGVRRTIARRLTEAKQSVPHFYVSIDVELDALLKLRDGTERAVGGGGAGRVQALGQRHADQGRRRRAAPRAGRQRRLDRGSDRALRGRGYQRRRFDPGRARSPRSSGARTRRASPRSAARSRIWSRARAPGNSGPRSSRAAASRSPIWACTACSEFAAIINPPQAAILAVAAGLQRPVVRDGALAIATVATCTLSADHRAVDGALAAEWLGVFRAIVEDPLRLML